MEIRNCKVCGKLYNDYLNKNVCPCCNEREEELFAKAKEYIRSAEGRISLQDLSENTGVSLYTIQRWIREERLFFSNKSADNSLKCAKCGAMITSGRYCINCRTNVIKQLKASNIDEMDSLPRNAKMRYLGNKE